MSTEQPDLDTGEETTVAADEKALENGEPQNAGQDDEDASPQQQLEKAQETIKEYWDQIMRLRADIENNRKRADRDVENAHKYALKSFVDNLLPIVDSLEMGQIAAGADNATLESIREGSALTMDMFVQVLRKSGLEQIDPVGEKLDPERQQAISMIEVEGRVTNTVVEVMQ